MENIKGIILKVTENAVSGIKLQLDLYDLVQPVLGNISGWISQTLTDIEYSPERATRAAFYHGRVQFENECRLIAEIIERSGLGKCYGHLITAMDAPLADEYGDDYDVEFPVGISLELNGEKKLFTVDLETLFSIHRLSKPAEWYKEWAKGYFGI